MNDQYFTLIASSTPCSSQSGFMYCGYTHRRSDERRAARGEPLAHLVDRRERMLGRDVVAVGREAAEVGGALVDQREPPVREVRRDLDAHVGHQPAAFAHERAHVVERDLGGPGGQRLGGPSRAIALRLLGDLGGLLAVVAPVRHEVLQDHLLEMPVLGVHRGERLERLDAVLLGLPDPDEDAAGERDAQLPGGADRLEPQRRILGRRALVGHQVGPQRLEHHALRGRDLAQAGEVVARQRAQVRVREQPALQRPLAAPGHVGHEVVEAELGQPGTHAGMVPGVVAREDEQLLHPPAHRAVQQALDLSGLVEVRPVGRERAVLAVRDARPRQRQRQVPGESDAARQPPVWTLQHRSRRGRVGSALEGEGEVVRVALVAAQGLQLVARRLERVVVARAPVSACGGALAVGT